MVSTADSAKINPSASAKSAGLRYVNDQRPGIQRKKLKHGFRYIDADGQAIKDKAVIQRITALAIPPAWENVWICPWDNGHIQATGRDAKLRKQYRYHPCWRAARDENKYERMVDFGRKLPALRKQIEDALARPGLPREKVLAIIVRLLELTLVRVGNEEYARANQSFGLTTLRNKHVHIHGSEVAFQFRGKSRVQHTLKLHDRRLANMIKRMRDLPGQELFQYIDSDGELHTITSDDVNDFLRTEMGEAFTAKDFRTWAGTLLATQALLKLERQTTPTQIKKDMDEVIKTVAHKLGNTPAVCKKCYVHPILFECYMDDKKWQGWQKCITTAHTEDDEWSCLEKTILTLLERK